jgi:hypothetical protein
MSRAWLRRRASPTISTSAAAYGRVCARLGRDRTEDLLGHMRRQIKRHGDEPDLADLAAAEDELRERRSRKGGRPRLPAS